MNSCNPVSRVDDEQYPTSRVLLRRALPTTVGLAYLTSLIVCTGVWFGVDYLPRQTHPQQGAAGIANAFGNWDGEWYARIVSDGYDYDRERHSDVALFPAYPLLADGVRRITRTPPMVALLLTTYLCLAIVFVLTGFYTRIRRTDDKDSHGRGV